MISTPCKTPRTRVYFRPVIPLLVSLIAGIIAGSRFSGHGDCAYCLALVCVCLILYFLYKNRGVVFTPTVLFFALGYLSIQPWVAPKFPPHHIVHLADADSWKITGVIDTPVAAYSNRQKFILRTETLERNTKNFTVTGKIRVTVSGRGPELILGDRIVFFGKVKPIRNFHNPGGFDYKRYMAFRKVYGTVYVSAQKLILLKRHSETGIGMIIADTRRKISDLIDKTGQGTENGVLKALIVGDRNSISNDLRQTFNRAGIGHLLAISGLHIGIVATGAFLIFKVLLSHIKFLLWHAWTKKAAVPLSVIPVFIYGLLSGMSPSTQRAVIMVTVFLAAFLFEREHDPMNTLAVAALLILVVHPPSLFSISFQLSFTAVLAILYGLSRVQTPWRSDSRGIKTPIRVRVATKLFYFLMVSFFAILGTLPLSMFYFNQISLVGLFANFIFVPLIGFVVVPLGLMSVFLYPLSGSVALGCLKAAAVVLEQALGMVHFFADLPFAAVKTITPSYLEMGCFYILFWAVLSLGYGSSNTPTEQDNLQDNLPGAEDNAPGKSFIRKPSAIIALLVILVLSADACYWFYNRFWHNDLRVTMIDVGHGNAALMELPEGYNILIDGGGFSDNSIFDTGARIIAPFLWQKKIKTVDTLVLSHPNSDHLNGLIYIAEHFNVKNVWTNNESVNTFGYKKFMETIKKNKIHMPDFKQISGSRDINGVCIDILYPQENFIERRIKESWRDLNNNSLVLKASFGEKSFLFPGDIEMRAEYELAAIAGDKLKSTVLLTPHHGSKTSSTERFIEKVNPEVIIISCGWQSRFGFPHPSVLKRYKEKGCRILGTAR
ncbi:MAG: ComEC/Rec2 family competence protein, partial [Desulfobacterales bacterium]